MAKSPHTPEFKAIISQEYLDGKGSYQFLADKHGVDKRTLRGWVSKYRLHGIIAFQNKSGNNTYSAEFKTMCVKAVLSGE